MTNVFDVTTFGAICDGQTADDVAYGKAISAVLNSKTGGIIWIPGIMFLANPRNPIDLEPGQGCLLGGNGPNFSGIKSAYGDTINFTSGDLLAGNVGAVGLAFKCASAGTANALELISSSTPDPGPTKGIKNCVFAPESGTTNYWAQPFVMDGCSFSTMYDIKVGGYFDGTKYHGGGGVLQNSQTAHAVEYLIEIYQAWNVAQAITVGDKIEGIQMVNSSVYGGAGINWIGGTSGLPSLIVMGTDFDCTDAAIQTQNIVQTQIMNNLFYVEQGGVAVNAANTINYGTNDNGKLIGNTVMGMGSNKTTNGFALAETGNYTVALNTINNVDTCIWNKKGSTGSRILDNICTNYGNVDILDQGTETVIRRV
jgi:hypothetical protein